VRVKSTIFTGGLGNAVIASAELGGALLVAFLALAKPLAAVIVVIVVLWLAMRLLRELRAKRSYSLHKIDKHHVHCSASSFLPINPIASPGPMPPSTPIPLKTSRRSARTGWCRRYAQRSRLRFLFCTISAAISLGSPHAGAHGLLPVANQARGFLPRYDLEAHCKELASFVRSYSEALENACLAREQSAYDALKNGWSDVPAEARTHCDIVARCCGTGSYFLLHACIQQELEGRSLRPKVHR
jgi:hypothetical protein